MDVSGLSGGELLAVVLLAIPVLMAVFAAIIFVVFRIVWAILTIVFHLAVIAVVAGILFGAIYLLANGGF